VVTEIEEIVLTLSSEHLQQVVRRALDYRPHTSVQLRKFLKNVVEAFVNIKGFQTPFNAPLGLIANEITRILRKPAGKEYLLWGIFRVWQESYSDLGQALDQFCTEQKINFEILSDASINDTSLTELVSTTVAAFIQTSPQYSPEDARLMCLCKIFCEESEEETSPGKELPVEGEESTCGLQSEIWCLWVEKLRHLPIDAPEWNEIDEFIHVIRQIAQEKALEGEHQQRTKNLVEALKNLQAERQDTFEFFGFIDIPEWDAKNVDTHKAHIVEQNIHDFAEKLTTHRENRGQTTKTLAEEEERRRLLELLEQEILALHQELAVFFAPSRPPIAERDPAAASEEESADKVMVIEESERAKEPQSEEPLETEKEQTGILSGEESPDLAEKQEEIALPIEDQEELIPKIEKQKPFIESPTEKLEKVEVTGEWEEFFWQLVLHDDLAGAYWLSRSLEAQQMATPVPASVVAAIQGVRWLKDDSGDLVDDLIRLAAESERPGPNDAVMIMGLAAALRGCLILPPNDMFGWLQVPNCLKPKATELVEAVENFVQRGCRLLPMDLLEAGKGEERQRSMQEVVHKVSRWLEEAPARKLKILRASKVWGHLVRDELSSWLQAVKADKRTQYEEVRRNLRQWQDQDFIKEQIERMDLKVTGLKKNPIVGEPQKQMIRWIVEICQEAAHWCNLVELEGKVQSQGDWLFNQAVILRERFQQVLPDIENTLQHLQEPFSLAAAAHCLGRSLIQIKSTLRLPHYFAPEKKQWQWLFSPGQSLDRSLRRRLLLMPDIILNEDYVPEDKSLEGMALIFKKYAGEDDPLVKACERYIALEDYQYLDNDLLPNLADTAAEAMTQRYNEARQQSTVRLRHRINETGTAIEKALIDGIIAEQDWSGFHAQVNAINPENELNFRKQQEKLRKIQDELRSAKENRLAKLQTDWQELEGRFHGAPTLIDNQQAIQNAIQRSIENHDTRVLEEQISHLQQVLEGAEDLDFGMFTTPSPPVREVKEFLSFSKEIDKKLTEGALQWRELDRSIKDGSIWAGLKFKYVSRPKRDEAVGALRAWQALKQGGADKPNNAQNLIPLLTYLGFSMDNNRRSPLLVEEKMTHGLRARVYMSASDLAKPIPQFGSLAKGQYDVICLWERPDKDTMAAKLLEKRLGQHPVILFYLGRLGERQRRGLLRRDLSAIAVLDEILLVFLTQEFENRLPAFLRCSLPFATLIPYTPFQPGDVPPEMFYGRQHMVRELQRPTGGCFVYGGRQLGKSALLRHVQREFHHPERGQYAQVKDIKLVGDPLADQPPQTIWRILRDALIQMNLLSEKISTEDPKQIEKRLRDVLTEEENRKILILFDEADNFFEADLKNNFREVERLRVLMSESERRFRVVFAGLNNVMRFQGIPNQPFAHFGSPLCVGPLEPQAARQLIREPLEALGYFFEDESLILQILSYTNYHPGLIQLFCQTLLQELHSRKTLPMPPYQICRSDVEAVYLKDSVRKEIKNRLEWTLALDKHYQAIAWTMVIEQQQERDSYARTFQVNELLDLVKSYWSKGFEDSSQEQIKTLLDEMCALNVLVRNTTGDYRLRSPNLVRLLGTELEIEGRLEELMDQVPPEPFDEQGHHAPLDAKAKRYSPFLYFQSAQLKKEKFGVGLIFASKALGFDLIPQALAKIIPEHFPRELSDCFEMPQDINNGNLLTLWLQQFLRERPKHQRLIAYRLLTGSMTDELAGLVQEALAFCQRHQHAKQRWLRLYFVFSPAGTWQWLSLPFKKRRQLEAEADSVTVTRCWNAVGIRQRLEQTRKQDTEEIVKQTLALTGGWPMLVDELFDRCENRDNPLPIINSMKIELADIQSPLCSAFRGALWLTEAEELPRQILEALNREGEIDKELFTPELMGLNTSFTNEDWERSVEFLIRMSCIDEKATTFRLNPIVQQVMGE